MAEEQKKRPRSRSPSLFISKRARHSSAASTSNSDISTTSRRSSRSNSSPGNYATFGRMAPGQCRRKVKVRPFEIVCLFHAGKELFPTYVRRGKPDAPILKRFLKSGKFSHPSLTEEQDKRFQFFSACIETFYKGLKLDEDESWIDTSSSLKNRYANCLAVEKDYGFAPYDISGAVGNIYQGFVGDFNNGDARKAMQSIFVLIRFLLCKKSNQGWINLGGASSVHDANSHFIEAIGNFNMDNFKSKGEDEKIKMVKQLIGGEEVDGKACNATPDVALRCETKFREEGVSDWFLFGECKFHQQEKYSMRGQVFKQCLRRLIDFDISHGFGMTTQSAYLAKLVLSNKSLNIYEKEFEFFTMDEGVENFFNCEEFLDFISCLTKITKDNCPDDHDD